MNDERVRLLLEKESSDSNYDDDFDGEVEDGSPPQEETRDLEDEIQSSDREDDSQSESEDYETNRDYYIGKDGRTRWNKTPRSSQCTNKEINRLKDKFSQERDCVETDPTEIEALLGLLLFAGVRRNSRLNAKDLFKIDESSSEIFRLAMSWNRFYLLLRCLGFDDKDTSSSGPLPPPPPHSPSISRLSIAHSSSIRSSFYPGSRQHTSRVLPLSLFYSDTSADGVKERQTRHKPSARPIVPLARTLGSGGTRL